MVEGHSMAFETIESVLWAGAFSLISLSIFITNLYLRQLEMSSALRFLNFAVPLNREGVNNIYAADSFAVDLLIYLALSFRNMFVGRIDFASPVSASSPYNVLPVHAAAFLMHNV